jgi:DMSO/TMAO reductase YedYZ heme-binding membrane subunit
MTGARLLFVIAMAVATMCAGLWFATQDVHAVIRWTARTSFTLWALAYVARPATALWPRRATKWLLRERKWIGDGFAVSQLAHMTAILSAAASPSAFAATIDAATVVGATSFVLVFAMAITSIDRVRAAMSKRAWNALHRTGMHLAWIVFTTTYVGRLASGAVWLIPVAVLAAITGVRVAAWLRQRSRARARVSVAA